MNRKTLNLILGAVALGLVGLATFQQQKDEARLAEPPKKGEPLSTLAATAIDHVVLHHPDAPDLVLERKDSHWMLTAPVQAAADSIEVGKLLALATVETKSLLDVATIKRADFGLEPPQFTLSLNDSVLAFGEIERLKYLRYVELNPGKPDDRLALITDPDAGILDSDYTDLLAKKLLPADAEIVKIELPDLKLERRDALWVAQPESPDATQDNMQWLVDTWKRAASIRNEIPVAPQGGESKHLTATLTLADGSTRVFEIVNRAPQLILDYAPLKVRYRLPPDESQRMLALPKPKADAAESKPGDAAPAAAK